MDKHHHRNHHDHKKIVTEESFLIVPHGRHIFSYSTEGLPANVFTSIVPDGKQGCGNDQDPDTVEVCYHPRGFDLICNITSDSAKVGYILEMVI